MSVPELIVNNILLEDIDFENKSGVVRISQKVYFLRDKSKLHPSLLNRDLANRLYNNKEIIDEISSIISKLLVDKFGIGKYGMFSKPPIVKINFFKYETDIKNKIDLLVFFEFV